MEGILFNILIFFIFLGPLIFFHELGHYLFARLAGVRVETFSIGFGPKLFTYKLWGTDFAFSAIPLGGYVKMFGEDVLGKEKIPESERQFAYNHKSVFARFWIVFGGPLANFIFAFFIYAGLLKFGEKLPAIKIGSMPQESKLLELGFQPGDYIKSINNETVLNLEDIGLYSGEINTIGVERKGTLVSLNNNLETEQLVKSIVESLGRLRKPFFIGSDKEIWVLSSSKEINEKLSLDELLVPGNQDSPLFFVNKKNPEKNIQTSLAKLKVDASTNGIYPQDLRIDQVVSGSPAEKAGLLAEDIIVSINSVELFSFDELRKKVQENKTEKAKFLVLRDGKTKEFNIIPEVKKYQGKEYYSVGVQSGVQFLTGQLIDYPPRSISDSVVIGVRRTYRDMQRTFHGFKKLLLGDVSMDSIGGPVAIAKVASNSIQISLSYFFRLMALISINLGIINLFPIPVLDGGHIVFLFLEAVNRGPLSRRKLEIAQQFGFSLLILLIILALYNDFNRFL